MSATTNNNDQISRPFFYLSIGFILCLASYFCWQVLSVNSWNTTQLGLHLAISIASIILFAGILRYYSTKLNSYKSNAQHKEHIKDLFLSKMSHEIKTPLNAIVGFSNLLLDETPRSDQLDNLKALKFSSKLLMTLVDDLLDFDRIESGTIELVNQRFNVHDLAYQVCHTYEFEAGSKQLLLKCEIKRAVPCWIKGDPIRLSQVLNHLLSNAIKYTPQGIVKLRLSIPKDKPPHQSVICFEVIDTGIGIAKEQRANIFKRFTQIDSTSTRHYDGAGLGLSISKRLLELLGSTIQVSSTPGKGSIFSFALPVTLASIPSPSSIQENKPIDAIPQFDKARVLLVEDNKINVVVAKKFLNRWGVITDVAENGIAGLEKVQKHRYDLVLMDLDMPVMDGYQATRAIRQLPQEQYHDIPIIALSASALAGLRQQAFDVGMNDFVTKPFDPDELQQVLSKFLDSPS